MSTYTQIYYHLVFSTKGREPVLLKERREALYRFIWGIVKNLHGHLYRVGGTEDHLHIFSDLHPSVRLADYVKTIKLGSADWIRKERVFPRFGHWQEGYGAFTLGPDGKDALIEYIKDQEAHHRIHSFLDEYRKFLTVAGVEFEESYLQ
ncbi:MAG: IS200/IS605 family transposase [Acidobacteria bacterium]|nr:IS200/IS605 family transposase [Acidobacteriota bacterium]